MRLLIYGLNHAPEPTGIGKFTGEMAAWLAARGHEVRVVTAPPYYPAWQIGAGYSGWLWRRETIEGARVYRCPLYVPAKPRGLTRILHLASFALSSFPVALWHAVRVANWRSSAASCVSRLQLSGSPTSGRAGRLGF